MRLLLEGRKKEAKKRGPKKERRRESWTNSVSQVESAVPAHKMDHIARGLDEVGAVGRFSVPPNSRDTARHKKWQVWQVVFAVSPGFAELQP
jgi:hypothetical protein